MAGQGPERAAVFGLDEKCELVCQKLSTVCFYFRLIFILMPDVYVIITSFIQSNLTEDELRPMTLNRTLLNTFTLRPRMNMLGDAGVLIYFSGVLISDGGLSFSCALHG